MVYLVTEYLNGGSIDKYYKNPNFINLNSK
jgi:hypothetical protein